MTDSKAFFEKIMNELEPLKEVVYFEPLSEEEVVELEKEWNTQLKPIVREFLLHLGFIQDVVKALSMDKESVEEDIRWLKDFQLTFR